MNIYFLGLSTSGNIHTGTLHVVTTILSGCSSLAKGLFRKDRNFLLIFCPKFPFEETSNNAAVRRRKACCLSFMPCSMSLFQFRFHASHTNYSPLGSDYTPFISILCLRLVLFKCVFVCVCLCLCMFMHVNWYISQPITILSAVKIS